MKSMDQVGVRLSGESWKSDILTNFWRIRYMGRGISDFDDWSSDGLGGGYRGGGETLKRDGIVEKVSSHGGSRLARAKF